MVVLCWDFQVDYIPVQNAFQIVIIPSHRRMQGARRFYGQPKPQHQATLLRLRPVLERGPAVQDDVVVEDLDIAAFQRRIGRGKKIAIRQGDYRVQNRHVQTFALLCRLGNIRVYFFDVNRLLRDYYHKNTSQACGQPYRSRPQSAS